jgi:uncharacterized protein involved in exopolysaccharide biosynthesis
MQDNERENPKVIYVPSFSDLANPAADEIDLREIWHALRRGQWFIAGVTGVATLIALLVAFMVLPVTYQSGAVLVPAQSPEDATSQLAGLAGNLGLPLALPGGEKSNSIMAFLESRSLKERLITKYELLPRLYPKLWDDGRKSWVVKNPAETPTVTKALQERALKDIYGVGQDKATDLIAITWVDRDPPFSALMLERIIKELQYYLENEYETDAQRERQFVEKQLGKATSELERWEQQIPSQNVPLAKIMRERLAAQTVYTELRKQLELARIAEAKELVRFKVLDPPFVPEKKFKPHRALIIGLASLIAAGLASFLVLARHFTRRRNSAPAP